MELLRLWPLLLLSGCFDPDLDGLYTCGVDADCPSGLSCAPDRLCRREPGVNAVDAGVDGSVDLAGRTSAPGDLAVTEDLSLPGDLSTPTDAPAPDLATPVDLACKPKKCMHHDCGDVDDGCGGVLHCKKCES